MIDYMIKYMIKCNSNATKPVKSRVSGCFDFALEVPLEIALEKYKYEKLKKRFDNLSTNIYNWRQIIEQEKKAIPLREITFKIRTLPELAVQVVPKI